MTKKPVETKQPVGSGEKILNAAYELFIKNGYHGTSMRQIAAKANLSVAALYNHFSGKEPLYEAVLVARHPFGSFLPAIEKAEGETAELLLRDAARHVVEALAQNREFLYLFFIEIVEFKNRHFPMVVERYLPFLQEFVRKLYSRKTSLRAFPPMVIVRSFFGLFFSYYMTELMIVPYLPKEHTVPVFDDFIDIYLHGVLDRPAAE